MVLLYKRGRGGCLPDQLLRRLEQFVRLTEDDREALRSRVERIQHFAAHEDLAQDGKEPPFMNLVLEGWACRYKHLEDGRRQIISLLLPGDICDPMVFLVSKKSHSLGTITPVKVARFGRAAMEALTMEHPNLARAFLSDMLMSTEIQREWTVNLGCRAAMPRMAHLLCELPLRLKAVGLSDGRECDLPMTQNDLADALGLSTVHVNRTLQELRGMGLIEWKAKRLTIRDEQRLRDLALFDPGYLSL